MTASILNGKLVADTIKSQLQSIVAEQSKARQRAPGLAVVLVGEDPASAIYVNAKQKACSQVGFKSFCHKLDSSVTEEYLLNLIDDLNTSPDIDGILVQLPLPKHIDSGRIIERISPQKDVDCFHPYNFGKLAQGKPTLRPCTPFGIIQLLKHYKLPIQGQNAVIIGASNIVGKPLALELVLEKATTTICNSKTQNLENLVKNADIIISATGITNLTKPEWFSKHQVVIDVGIHRLDNGTLRGDIDFEAVRQKVAWITPVPGGVGPMTIATLLQNTMLARGYFELS